MSLSLVQNVASFLQDNPDKKFTAREIANWIFETFPDECEKKKNRSTAKVAPIDSDTALISQLVAEIGRNKPGLQKNPKIKTTEGRPRKYYFTESTDSDEVELAESNANSNSKEITPRITEHDLYPVLSKFLFSELGVYSKRVDEKRSKNNNSAGTNKWLYPDLVGMESLSEDWHREIKDCVKEYADKKTRLWSFEVKLLINRSNVREAFFQAVSNSSWANLGYLVANEMTGDSTIKELRILTALHGIGFILLDSENPSESQIIIPAKLRDEVDWDTANRLATENKDFLEYIKLIRQFYQIGEIKKSDWDAKPYKD